MTLEIIIYIVYCTITVVIAAHFMKTWGWGDAAWGVKEYHQGKSDDIWHKRRRRAFYAIVVVSLALNPLGLVLILIFGRKLFREGVRAVGHGVYERWYGK